MIDSWSDIKHIILKGLQVNGTSVLFRLGSAEKDSVDLETNEHLWGDDAYHIKDAVAL